MSLFGTIAVLVPNYTIKVPKGYSNSKAKKYLTEQGVAFEQELRSKSEGNALESSHDQMLPEKHYTLQEYSEMAIRVKEALGVKASTIAGYEEKLERINGYLGQMPLESIRPSHLNQFYLELAKDGQNKRTGGGLSAKSIREHHSLIRSILQMAVDDELISTNPAAKAKPPKVNKADIRCFTEEELKEVLSCAADEPINWHLMLVLFATLGARRGEILGLTWSDLDLDSDSPVVYIRHNLLYTSNKGIYRDTPKTPASVRTLRLSGLAVDLLKEYKKWQDAEIYKYGDAYTKTDYVFTKVLGTPMHPDSVTDYMRKFGKKYNLPHVNPHKFRHTVASILIFKGYDVATVSRYLGHDNPEVTSRIYAHYFEEALAKASDALGEILLE